jgi:hypothetical protein
VTAGGRGLTAAAVLVGVLVLGTLARLPPPPGGELRIDLPAVRPGPPPPAPRGLLARLIDPFTLADVPGRFMPVEAGWAAFSDDGRLLALPGADQATVLDRDSFAVVAVLDGDLPADLRFSPEMDALVGSSAGSVLVRRPLEPAAPGTRVVLPTGLAAVETAMLGGGRMAVLAVPVGAATEASTIPRVLVADLLNERILLDLPLPGLAGLPEPLVAWDTGTERLYLVSAEGRRLVAVDLAAGAVAAGVDLPPSGATPRSAVLSVDGRRLYLGTPRELVVLATADLSVERRLDVPALHVATSRDGRWLAVGGDEDGVRVLSERTLDEAGHLAPGERVRAEFGRAADLVYLRIRAGDGTRVQAITLPRLEVLGERTQEVREYLDVAGGLRFLPL